ncbi:MAG: 5-formyltetrahydrofolate cyclo-ligase [Candidatus Micrarchaeota archaeon]
MKHRIRRRMLEKRGNHRPHHAKGKSGRITERLLALPEIQEARTVMAYYPLPQEADCLGAVRELLAGGKTVALPRVEGRLIVPVRIGGLRGMRKGGMGVVEPARGRRVAPKQIDVVIVPGVAFDLRGHRLGFGGGHYDRFLKTVRRDCAKIGLAFELQLVKRLPAQSHDVPMDAVVTEKRTLKAKRV